MQQRVPDVAAVIEPGMLRSEAQRRGRGTSGAMSAWDLVFQGMWYFHHWRREHHHTACELFRRAIAADPLLPAGHIWLCRGLDGMRYCGWSVDLVADLREETAAAERIQQFGEADPYALYAITIQANAVGNSGRAIDAAQRTIDLCPSFALGHVILGVSRIWAGRAAAAIEPLQRGLRLNPSDTQSFQWVHFVSLARLLLGDLDQALEKATEAAALRPDIYCAHLIRTVSLSLLGRDGDAREALGQMHQRLLGPMIVEQYLDRFKSAADRALVEEGLRRAGWTPGS